MEMNNLFQTFFALFWRLTQRWWFYVLLVLLFFLPTFSTVSFDQRQSPLVIQQVLKDPLIYRYPLLMPLAKVSTAVLVAAIFIFGNRARRVFNIYMTLIYLGLALFQTSAITEDATIRLRRRRRFSASLCGWWVRRLRRRTRIAWVPSALVTSWASPSTGPRLRVRSRLSISSIV